MSLSVHVSALRSAKDNKPLEMVLIKLKCDSLGLSYPPELVDFFGDEIDLQETRYDDPDTLYQSVMETDVEGDGDVMYGDGMVIQLEDLPEGTVSLRIYSEA